MLQFGQISYFKLVRCYRQVKYHTDTDLSSGRTLQTGHIDCFKLVRCTSQVNYHGDLPACWMLQLVQISCFKLVQCYSQLKQHIASSWYDVTDGISCFFKLVHGLKAGWISCLCWPSRWSDAAGIVNLKVLAVHIVSQSPLRSMEFWIVFCEIYILRLLVVKRGPS